jgi:hypothetical protein
MMNFRKASVCGALLLFGAAGCADLLVDNTNQPDRDRALSTPGDVQSLIDGAYRQWYSGAHMHLGPTMIFSTAAFQHSSTAANFGILNYSKIPRIPVANSVTHADYGNIEFAWQQNYRALAALAEGLRVIDQDPAISEGLGAAGVLRSRIYGKFVQGLSHGSLALIYDRAYIVDESVQVIDENGAPILLGEPVPYTQVMNAALGFLDQAIALAQTPAAAGITIPANVMATPAPVGMAELVRIANSFKARFRANVARTPAERAAVNWTAVLNEAANGITTNFVNDNAIAFGQWTGFNDARPYMWASTWQQINYFIFGMADQSGNYQTWSHLPLPDRAQMFPGTTTPVLIVTPDLRFPQGETLQQQVNNWGRYVGIRRSGTPPAANVANAVQFSNAERGTWRWSHYYNRRFDANGGCQVGTCVEISVHEMRLLAAEAYYRLGDLDEAAELINVSREFHGLSPADPHAANHGNDSCVPRLADGTCGNLFEMLKWEKRMETWGEGPYTSTWYFDGRGWGDLYAGTPLQFPIPAEQLHVLQLGATYTFGGVGGTMAAPGNPAYYPTE